MKITKKVIKANSEIPEAAQLPVVVDEVVEEVVEDSCCEACYQEAIEKIMDAITSLGCMAKDDPLARESIANLSVVLFDLKG